MTSTEIADLTHWITKNIDAHDFGELHITVKLRGGKPQMVQRSFVENILLSGKTGGGKDDSNNL